MKLKKQIKLLVACDGGAASGKTTASKLISKKYKLHFLSSGLLYRYVSYKLLSKNKLLNKNIYIKKITKNITLSQLKNRKLYNQNVTRYASEIAKSKKIRMLLKKYQKNFSKQNHVCIEGRDIGNVICPNADVKIFFKCNLKVRAKRRWNEYKKNSETSPDEDLAENLENVEALWPAADRTLAAKAQNLPCHVGPVRTYDEIQLLKALMRRPDFLKKKALKTVARDQHQQFEMTMWRYINRSASELHNAYHWDRMATYYNTIIYETIGNGETLIPVCPRYLSSEVRELKVKEMTLKEPKHLKDAAKILAVKVSVKVAQGSTPSQQEHHDRYVQAQAKAVHHHRAAGIVPKLKTRKAPVERQAAPATVPNMNASGIQDISSSKKRKICPDSACAITMAGSRKHNPRCRFERWRTVPVNKKNRRKGKETPTEAQLRAFQARNAHPTQHHGGTARVRGGGGGCQGRGRGRGRGGGRDAAQGGRGRGRGRDRGRGRRRRRGM